LEYDKPVIETYRDPNGQNTGLGVPMPLFRARFTDGLTVQGADPSRDTAVQKVLEKLAERGYSAERQQYQVIHRSRPPAG
jgi:hypothetical protein